jgi:hypothetical protein
MTIDVVPDRPTAVARAVTEVLAPWVVVLVLPVPIAWHSTGRVLPTVLWSLVTAVCGSLVPMAVILRAVRKGDLTDHHVGRREQRFWPLAVGLGSVVAGLGILLVAGAPAAMVALCTAELAAVAVALVISVWWKVSVHAMVAAGAATMVTLTFGAALAALALPVAAVCWSRVRLRDHTWAQVTTGATLGTLISAPIFLALR